MREDRFTMTPADAEWFERHRGGGYGPPEDQPTRSELAEDAALDAAAARDIKRRLAAGEHVPDVWDNLAAIAAMQRLPGVAAEPVRPRVLRLTATVPVSAEAATVALSPDFEVREHDGTLWVRVTDAYHAHLSAPPF